MEGERNVAHSLCIKTNNKKIIDYLLKRLEDTKFIFLENEFKIYKNIIVHSSKDKNSFHDTLADFITDVIFEFYQETLVKKIINTNYFYFADSEKKSIYKSTLSSLKDNAIQIKGTIFNSVLRYISENDSIILDGFVNFRLKCYMKTLDNSIDLAVDDFLVQREYYEFVNLLKGYIDSRENNCGLIHIIYYNQEAIILDEYNNVIDIDDSILNAKYLSDISFSRNDYVLNTLLTIIPKKIVVHLLDKKDEFINTIELIFDKKISFCSSCKLCNKYKHVQVQR